MESFKALAQAAGKAWIIWRSGNRSTFKCLVGLSLGRFMNNQKDKVLQVFLTPSVRNVLCHILMKYSLIFFNPLSYRANLYLALEASCVKVPAQSPDPDCMCFSWLRKNVLTTLIAYC